jgi:diacylglycerol kinase family enzyme
MRIAPDARADDGQFDVVLIEGMPRLQAIRALNTVYDGTHVLRNDVHVARGSVVEVSTPKGALPMELDGESRSGGPIRFEALHSALNMLVSPSL